MKRSIFYIFVGLILSTAFFSCNGQKKPVNGRTDTPTSGTISFVSDESFSPIVEELRQQFEFDYPKAHLKPIYIDEITGLNMIRDLKTCLLITSRALKPSELAYLKSKNQVPSVFPIGYDGLALIVNPNNSDTCITVDNFKRILLGKATKWNQVVKGSKRGEIEVVFDNAHSATLHYVVDSILHGHPINSPNIVAAKNSKAVIDYVHNTPNAIGIIGSNWLNDRGDTTNTTFKKNVHVMSVSIMKEATPMNSWKPYQAYLLDGRYPFVRTIYAICVDPQQALPWSFANFLTSPRGQLIIFRAGLLPYRGDIQIKPVEIKNQ